MEFNGSGRRTFLALATLAVASATGITTQGEGPGFALGASPLQAQANTGTVTGQVTDARTLAPLPGAQVSIPSAGIGVLTNSAGRYILLNVPAGPAGVQVSLIGYAPAEETVTVAAGGSASADFQLRQEALALDEVVVTGTPGGTQRRAIGNEVVRVDAAEIMTKAPVTSMDQLLSGRTAGVNVLMSSGNIGASGGVRLRGVSSLSLLSEPLIYIDGIRVDNNSRGGPSGMREDRPSHRLNQINPADIESIEIIKGPAAATLYGTEAANGVIQIITKRGAVGAPRFEFSTQQGSNFYLDPEGRFPTNYRRINGELVAWNAVQQEKELGIIPGGIFGYGPIRSYTGSVSGGTNGVRYYVAGEAGREEGAIRTNWQDHYSARSNVDIILSDNLDAGIGFGFRRGNTRYAQNQAPFGIWDGVVWGHAQRQNEVNGKQLRGWYAAPPEEIEKIEAYGEVDRITASLQTNWRPTSWLHQRLNVGIDVTGEINTQLFPRQVEGRSHFFAARGEGEKRWEQRRTTVTSFDYAATGRWQLTQALGGATSVGLQYFDNYMDTGSSQGRVFAAPMVTTVGATAVTFGSEDRIQNKTFGAFIQQEFDWRNRIFITGAVRGDDNSAFGANYDAVIYPKLSGTWVINEEPWWSMPWISTLRLRTAWGWAGQQPDVFAASQLYNPVTGPGDEAVLTPGSIGNPDLAPERSGELEAGFDLALFDDRITTTFTYYNQVMKDALIERSVAPSIGFTGTQWFNAGEVKNTGIELSVDANVVNSQAFRWDLGYSHGTNKNELVSLGGLSEACGQLECLKEGYPLWGFWKVNVLSAEFDERGRAVNAMCEQLEGPALPCAQSAPKIYQGPQYPEWQGSVNSTLTLLNNLSLYANVEYKGGYHRGDGDVGFALVQMGVTEAEHGFADGRGPDPILHAYKAMSANINRALWIHDASFARLREVSATYRAPARYADRLGASQLSFTASARNLWFLWRAEDNILGRQVVDPESRRSRQFESNTQTVLPPLSSIIATVRVSF